MAFIPSRIFNKCHHLTRKINKMHILTIPALSDNFMYLMYDNNKNGAVIDPVEPKKIDEKVKELGINLQCVLATHHHWDHSGGNKELHKLYPNLNIYGGCERVESVNKIAKDMEKINIGSISVTCLSTPCHTSSHICYYATDSADVNSPPAVFTGDTLFIAGCGKFFEGTPEQMVHALIEKIGKLPLDTKVYCGHEYTKKNLLFAKSVDPNNQEVAAKLAWVEDHNGPTVPSTVGDELQHNVFMRANIPEFQQILGKTSAVETMGYLRQLKDRF